MKKMMPTDVKHNIDRILVSLDFDDADRLFIKSLVALASQLNAELCGLRIEDSDLQQVANLPFSREITFPSASTRNLDRNYIEQQLKHHAEELHKAMLELSKLSNVTYSYKSIKGPRIESLIKEAYGLELIVLLPEKYTLISSGHRQTLDEVINPTIIFYDNSVQARKSARIIQSLANTGSLKHIKVLTVDSVSNNTAHHLFSFPGINTEFQHINSYQLNDTVSLLKSEKIGLVILPMENKLVAQTREIKNILDTLKCPLLLVH